MNYELNGKIIRIPDSEIEKSMKILDMTQAEAIQMYLEDEGYFENQEQEALERKAKDNRITATIHQAKTIENKKKTPRERTPKPDPTKEKIIETCAEAIRQLCGNATIINKTKYITFEMSEEQFEINLVRHKKKKE